MKNIIKSLTVGSILLAFFAMNAFSASATMYLINGDTASTLAPTGVSDTSMTLRGNYNVNGTGPIQTWFEYASSYDLVSSGAGQLIGNSSHDIPAGTFTYSWNNLTPNTTYYFRAVVAQNGRVSNGNILGMKTINTTNPTNYAPTLNSISTTSGYQGNTYTIVLNGANFISGTNVNFGSGITVNSVNINSSTQISANIVISSSAYIGSRSVTVNNANGTSNGINFTVNQYNNGGNCNSNNPTIYSISPDYVSNTNSNINVVISGYNFTTSSTAMWRGSSRPTYFNSSTQLTMTLYASDLVNNSSGSVSVTNNNNCNTSNSMTLRIDNIDPCYNYNYNNGCGVCGNGCNYQAPTVTTLSSNVYGSSITFNGSVNTNNNQATVWFRYGTSSYSMGNETTHTYQSSNTWGTNFSATINATPNTTYYYQAVANNAYGTVYGNVMTTVMNNYNYPTVTTVVATNKTTTSARLNAVASGFATQGYFEYGETASLGNVTPSKYIGVGNDVYSVNYSDTIYNLQPGTTYYFRAVASNTNGTSKGNIFLFQTPSIYVPVDNTTPASTVTTSNELINITSSSDGLYLGDNVEYTVTYKNNTKQNFENTVITVQLPKEVIFDESTFGRINNDNAVVFSVGNLTKTQTGSITIRGHLNKESTNSTSLITTAIMTYNVAGSNVEKNEIAFVTNHILNGNSLAAASLFGAGFMPTTLIGWVALLLVILALIALIRHLYLGYNNNPRPLV
jgi:hypothetical protein